METKQIKLKSKMMKAVTAITLTFHNHPFSPGRDHHNQKSRQKESANKWVKPYGGGKGFSGPIIRKHPNDIGVNNTNETGRVDYQEPTSPKISCMGQIKHKKKEHAKKSKMPSSSRDIEVKKHVTTFHRMLFHVGKPKSAERRKSDASAPQDNKYALEDTSAPRVSDMKRFASGRDTFDNFDWKQEVHEESDDEEEEDDVIIPFSAPILVGCGGGVLDLKPRKEINLWKRRTMAPPRPLQLDLIV